MPVGHVLLRRRRLRSVRLHGGMLGGVHMRHANYRPLSGRLLSETSNCLYKWYHFICDLVDYIDR